MSKIMFNKSVFLTIFQSVIHADCLLFMHFLAARHHRGQIVKKLSLRVCPVCGLTRYHQLTVHIMKLSGFHNTLEVDFFDILGRDIYIKPWGNTWSKNYRKTQGSLL